MQISKTNCFKTVLAFKNGNKTNFSEETKTVIKLFEIACYSKKLFFNHKDICKSFMSIYAEFLFCSICTVLILTTSDGALFKYKYIISSFR